MSNNIENLLKQINNGDNLTEIDLNKYADNLLHKQSSNDACRIFLTMFNKQKFLSDEIYDRICNIIINNHEQSAKENAIRTIDLLIQNNRNVSDLCLNALEIAFQDQQSQILRIYASKIFYFIIEKLTNIHFNSSLLNSISNGLQDSSIKVQSYTCQFFEIFIRKQPHASISQQIIDNMGSYLSKIYKNIDKNYIDCGLISSFFLNLLYHQYKIDAHLLEIFSELLIIQSNVDKELLVNLSASYVLYKAIENQLINGCLSQEVFIHISNCFNSKGFDNEKLFGYCLKILCALNDEQLKLTQLNGNLFKIYLKDSNFDENQRIHITMLFGNLCQFSYKYVDEETNTSIIDYIIDVLFERLDQEKYLQSSIYVLTNIAQYEQNSLSIYPLQKFVFILNQNNIHKEIRQNACLILRFAIETQQILTNYEIDALENALNDSDSTLSLIALQAFQYLFKNYHQNIDLIESYVNKLCTFATELISYSNEIFTSNASNLLEIALKYNLKHEFSYDEIENVCIGLQTNLNSSIRRSISNSLQQIISKQSDFPSYTSYLIKLENLTEEFLRKENIDCETFETDVIQYFHENNFEKKIIPINLLEAINRILKRNFYSLKLVSILHQCAENNLKFPNDLIEILFEQFRMNKSEILIQILYYIIVQNGQSLTENFLQKFQESFLQNQFSSTYTIDILKFLINRNHIQIDMKKLIDLLEKSNDSHIQSILLETLAYALKNQSSNIHLLINQILKLVENYFQSNSSTKQMKYYSCLAINALLQHKIINLSKSTLDLLKRTYAEDDDFKSTINLRDISLTILKQYLSNDNEINDLINQEKLEEKLLDYENPSNRLKAGKELLSIVKNQNRCLSKLQLKILELSLNFSNSPIEYKSIVLNIFQYHSADLNLSQIELIFVFINENQLNTTVIKICKSLVDLKRLFSDEIFKQLIDFIFENSNRILRDSLIDCLKEIVQYQSISKGLFNRIQLEILSKVLRDSRNDIQKKKFAINKCLEYIGEQHKLSLNTIDSLEYLLKNSSEIKNIEKEVFDLIELAIRYRQKLPSTFVNYLSRLMKDTQMDRNRLISIMNHLSIHSEQEITQEIFDNAQEYFIENFDKSFEILLQGTQNGCQLNSTMINSLKTNNTQSQHDNILKILKNQVKHKFIFDDDDLIQYLENHFQDNPQLILNILKYLPTYEPSSAMKTNLQNLLIKHRFCFQFEIILNQIIDLPIQIQLHFTQICFLIKHIQFDIVAVYPLKFICRQLLCYNLLENIIQQNKYEKIDELEFYANLNNLEEYFSFQLHSIERDEILIYLIENSSIFTLKQISNILYLLKTDSKALEILFNSSSNDCLKNLQIHWLYFIINRYSYIRLNGNIHLNDDQADQILDLLLTKLQFSISLSECFLQRIHHIENLNELIEFLTYLYENNVSNEINLSDYFTGEIIAKDLFSWLLDIQSDLIRKKIVNVCQQRNFNELKMFENLQLIILSIRLNNWSFEIFEKLIEILETKQDQSFPLIVENLINSLIVINNFGISNQYEDKIELIFKSTKSQDWSKEIHQFAVSVSFDRNEQEKTLTDLINEIKKSNDFDDNQKIEFLEENYRELISIYDSDSEFYSIGKPIKIWNEEEISKWSAQYKLHRNQLSNRITFELICVIKRAIYLHNPKQKFETRIIQILSLLLLLDASEKQIARLAQIKTGEGKSVIIAMFAAMKALNGHQVDIVTTSPLLAKRDAENKKTFYQMLNLTVGENSGTSTIKSCYKNDIVYGNVNEFQFDILKDEYSLLGTRCRRKFDIAIVDEVDSMFIDENSKVCRLSNKIPAIDELKIILTIIWQELNRIYERIVRIENKLYCIMVPYRIDENGQIILMKPVTADDDGNVLENSTVSDDNQENFLEIDETYVFVENHIRNYVENKLLKPNEKNECLINIPKHLISFVQQQIPKWIFNAWQAKFAYRENIDYLIADEKNGRKSIVPIDYRNTGIIQTNTSWPDGLHQFLQIKHRLRISAENLTTNFLSNVAFFSRYGTNLFGLTGTLGTPEAKDLIHYIYKVDFVIIPPYKYTQFILYPDRLCLLEDDWLNECIKSISIEAKQNQRAVLVICETKSNATKIYDKLIEKDQQFKKLIKLYTRSDNDEQNAIENELDCGQIIVATNLAGRGTDIGTTHRVEENGGLHVLVTFLPLNTRVEQQAFGRTSRQGKRGTAQLIVCDNENKYGNIEDLKNDRNLREKYLIDRAKCTDLKNIVRRDRLFQKFCDLRQELRRKENDTYKLDSVEELWGLWLKTTFAKEDSITEKETNHLTDELLEQKFQEFSSKITKDYSSNEIFQNPFYLILKANEYLFQMKDYDRAIELHQDAIASDPIFAVSARYNLAYALIKQSTKNKNEAKSELEKALETLENILIAQHQTMLISFDTNPNETNSKLQSDAEEQIMNRINLLYLCKSLIEQGIAVINETEENNKKIGLQYKVLDEFFSDINKPTLDINEFKESGFVGFFQLMSKEPTPWLSIVAVGIIGLAQAAAGAAIIVFSSGAAINIGSMLLSEGINDMIFAIKCGITGEFSWKEYGIQKAISLTITIATCGISALKETGQLMKSGFKGCTSMVKTATIGGQQIIGQFTKNGWKLVGEQIVHAFVKAGAKEVIKTVLDKTVLAEISKNMNKEITKNIQTKVNDEVQRNRIINQCLTVNIALQKPNVYYQEIERLVCRILHPQSNRFAEAAITIAKGILNRLTDGTSGYAFQIITAGKCLSELSTFLEKFFLEFNDDLVKLKYQLKIDYLLHSNNSKDVDKRTAKEITESLKKQQYIDQDHIQVLKPIELPAFKLTRHENHQVYVINVCNNIYTETTKHSEYAFEKNLITQTITIQLASYMINRLNAELINPVVHAGIDATVNYLANKIERACADSRETLEERIRNRRAQNDVIRQGEFLRKRTDKHQKKDEIIHPEIENLAHNVENDAPGDLKDIIAVSAKLGLPVQIYHNGKYEMTIGDTNSGEPLKVNFGEGQTGNIGHYTGVNGGNNVIRTGATDCLFDTLAAQTNMSSNELRQIAAAGIRENSDLYLKMMPSLNFLREKRDKSLLYTGGDNTAARRARNHSPDAILDDRYLPSRKRLEEDLEKILTEIKKYKPESEKNPSGIERELILKTIIHDINDQGIKEAIADDKNMRNIFYDSLNRRLAYFKETNEELFTKSATIETTFNNVASYWKNQTHSQVKWDLYYSQASVNANFSRCSSAKAIDFLPQPIREMIAGQPLETAGKEAIKTYGPAVCPVQVFSYRNKLVAIDNRMTLAHVELAKVKPLRLIPAKPSGTELGRMNRPGMPSTNRPKYDKNA